MAPVRRTARSTSDNASISASRTIEQEYRTAGHSVAQGRSIECPHQDSFNLTGRFNMASEKIFKGACFCGEVQFEVSGEPAGMGYCHCESCRHWSAGPVNAFTLWNPQSLKITRGAGRIR